MNEMALTANFDQARLVKVVKSYDLWIVWVFFIHEMQLCNFNNSFNDSFLKSDRNGTVEMFGYSCSL